MKQLLIILSLITLCAINGEATGEKKKITGYNCGYNLKISFEKGLADFVSLSGGDVKVLPFFGRVSLPDGNSSFIFGPYHPGMCHIILKSPEENQTIAQYTCRNFANHIGHTYRFNCQALYESQTDDGAIEDPTNTEVALPTKTNGTADDTKKAVDEAIAYYDKHGPMATYEAVNHRGMFRHAKDTYVVILQASQDGFIMAHGFHSGYIGFNVQKMETPDDRFVGLEMVEQSLKNGEDQGAWITYDWKNYHNDKNGALESRKTWFVLHDGLVFLAGYYTSL